MQKVLNSLKTKGYDVTTREEPTYTPEEVLGAATPARLCEGLTQE